MSIDLSKAKAISDPYGAWKQLADASGRVLWSAVKDPVVTITGVGGTNSRGCTLAVYVFNITTGEVTNVVGSADIVHTIKAPIGSTVTVKISVTGDKYEDTKSFIYVNGTEVENDKLKSGEYISWTHTISTNTNIVGEYIDKGYEYSSPTITITADGIVTFQTAYKSSSGSLMNYHTLFAVEGMTWADWCDSDYNTYGYTCYNSTSWAVAYNGEEINVGYNDVIIAGKTYERTD